ncbi:MAG TPA: hypothetical protein PLF48_02125, partial [Chitinophagales bacterium]|nr:hypothetical protein [Chitinophagales bacterium]
MNKKIKNYTALAAVSIAVLPMACKKDKDTTSTNDENIIDRTINQTLTATGSASEFGVEDSIDINSDGIFDFKLNTGGGAYYGSTYGYGYIHSLRTNTDLLTENATFGSETVKVLKTQNSGAKINAASSAWYYYGFTGYTYTGYTSVGFAGAGDKYIGFRLGLSDGSHYGWMKVNQSSDFRTLKVIELAYHK